MTERHDTSTNGTRKDAPSMDPVYDIPLLGPLVKEADALRARLQGKTLTRKEAELLRMEARALRHLANYLETRALQLDRLHRQEHQEPRVTRIRID